MFTVETKKNKEYKNETMQERLHEGFQVLHFVSSARGQAMLPWRSLRRSGTGCCPVVDALHKRTARCGGRVGLRCISQRQQGKNQDSRVVWQARKAGKCRYGRTAREV